MEENDTIRLLRECDAGIKMGTSAINEVTEQAQNQQLANILRRSKGAHEQLDRELRTLLDKYHDDGKQPPMMAKGMSWLKTNTKLAMDASDETVADLITDGCNMGVKSLHRYLNQYKDADNSAKDICRRIIELEEELVSDMHEYL